MSLWYLNCIIWFWDVVTLAMLLRLPSFFRFLRLMGWKRYSPWARRLDIKSCFVSFPINSAFKTSLTTSAVAVVNEEWICKFSLNIKRVNKIAYSFLNFQFTSLYLWMFCISMIYMTFFSRPISHLQFCIHIQRTSMSKSYSFLVDANICQLTIKSRVSTTFGCSMTHKTFFHNFSKITSISWYKWTCNIEYTILNQISSSWMWFINICDKHCKICEISCLILFTVTKEIIRHQI